MPMAVSLIKGSGGLLSAALVGLSVLAQAQPYNSERRQIAGEPTLFMGRPIGSRFSPPT